MNIASSFPVLALNDTAAVGHAGNAGADTMFPVPLRLALLVSSSTLSAATTLSTGPGAHVTMARELGRGFRQAKIQHEFVPELQAPQAELQWSADLVNVIRDLGSNNPSVQYDGTNWHYHFKRGDAGWLSAFELANRLAIHKIYFPRGVYWFGDTTSSPPVYNPTIVDLSLYPRLWNGESIEVFGDGDYQTSFTTWGPITNGSMLEISSSKTIATMAQRFHGFHFDGCASDFSFSINSVHAVQPRAEHNDFGLYDCTFINVLMDNTCDGGRHFHPSPSQQRTYARGAAFFGHIWSSKIDFGLAAVLTSAPASEYNRTGGVVLTEVQYTTMRLTGTGSHYGDVQPWNETNYVGWGVLMMDNNNGNTVTELHCEGSGGCIKVDGVGNFENKFTTCQMGMMQKALISSTQAAEDTMTYNEFDHIVVNRYPVNRSSGQQPTGGACKANSDDCVKFSKLVEGDPRHVVVHHMTVIADDPVPTPAAAAPAALSLPPTSGVALAGGCTAQLAKDGCSASLRKQACDACTGAHQADLRAAGCTAAFVTSFCAGQGPATQAYSTEFEKAEPDNWELETTCSHCGNHGGDECTQFTKGAVQYGAVTSGRGVNITSAPLASKSKCGGICSSGHLTLKQQVHFGTFSVAARWFPGVPSAGLSSASGFIGLFAAGKLGGSMTFIFHGKGWKDGSHADFRHTFQSEVYRTGQNHNKINTAGLHPDVSAEIALYELEWLPDRVHWRVNGKLVRTWHPESNSTIPQDPMQLRLHSRSGFCSKMKPGSSFDAQILNFSYAPAATAAGY
jgi:hypothetical protein